MRRFIAPAALAILAGCTQGEIKGHIIVGPTTGNQVVYAALWSVPSQPSTTGDSGSTLVPQSNGTPTPAGSTPVGTAPAGGGTFDYSFTDLSPGLYMVGAYLDTVDDSNPNIIALVHTIDTAQILDVEPSQKSKAVVDQDIYLAESAPGTGTVRGTVHMNSAAEAVPDIVWALDGSLISAAPNVIAEQQIAGGTSEPFALFNLPLEPLYLFGDADVGSDGSLDNDILAFPVTSPLTLTASQPEVDGVDLWLGAQNPAVGSITGQIQLSSALPQGTTANVQLYAQEDGYDATSPLVALVNVPVTGSGAPFTLSSVPYGSLYVSSGVQVTIDGQALAGSSYYPGAPSAPSAITLSATSPTASITVPVGLNEVSGNVTLTGVPASVGAVWIVAAITVGDSPFIVAGDLLPLSGTGSPAPFAYSIFGLDNTTYQIDLVPAATSQTSLEAALSASSTFYPGSPAQVTFDGSARATSNFTVSF